MSYGDGAATQISFLDQFLRLSHQSQAAVEVLVLDLLLTEEARTAASRPAAPHVIPSQRNSKSGRAREFGGLRLVARAHTTPRG